MTTGRIKRSTLLAAGIGIDYFPCTVDNYEGPRPARKFLGKYISNLEPISKKGISFLLYGVCNSGKTTFANILAKAFLLAGKSAKVTNLQDMTDLFTSGWTDPAQKGRFNEELKKCDLLVIDDLKKELFNKATASVLDSVLRYRSNHHLPFVITTNASLDELKSLYGESFMALVERRCVKVEFNVNGKMADTLIDRNLAILEAIDDAE